jgi:diguanylate cyclase (GGDEF)-like protein
MFSTAAPHAAATVHQAVLPLVTKRGPIARDVRALLLVGAVVLVSSLLGLGSRHAFSVSFWPANGVLVGLMLRHQSSNHWAGWLGALLGYVAADLLYGRTLSLAAFFAAANLIGALTATTFLMRLDARDLSLRRVHSVLRILASLLPGCLAAALCGALLVKVEFDGSASQTLLTWPASELVNYLVVLPAMLTVPPPSAWFAHRDTPVVRSRAEMWPALLLAISCVAAVCFDGPGSIMFPMPALLLCALTFPVPRTALITLALGVGCLTTIGFGVIDIGQNMADPRNVVSVRIAVAFLVLVPLTISSAMAVRDDLLDQLRDAANHDGLTGLLNRRAFEQQMQARMAATRRSGGGVAVLWLDIDHFKAINDRHGHLAGDAVLQMFAATARACCRADDLVARMGGEEFALMIDVADAGAAAAIADRLHAAFAAQTVLWNSEAVRATVSIAACHVSAAHTDMADLFKRLDEALYLAKRQGRNRVEWLGDRAIAGSIEPIRPSIHRTHAG